jgi:putative ABC transport system permease protein
MFRIYLRSAFRNLVRHRTYTFLNVFGLATGMAACIVILLFAYYEKSFDGMHHRNLYRLNEADKFTATGIIQKKAETMFAMGPTMKAEFPEVVNYCRVDGVGQYEMTYGEKRMFFPQTFFVDSSFLDMFDFPLLHGDRQTALQKPNSIVLTESAARKLFGVTDPIGKTIAHFDRDTVVFTVTGILKDIPGNSQLQFDALQSFNTIYKPGWMDHWNDHWVGTYLELSRNTDMTILEGKFPAYLDRHHIKSKDIQSGLFLLPLKEVHANSTEILYDDEINFQKFDRRYTNIFLFVGFLVLLIACINYMNLATAQSADRAKEVGIRKTVGALRRQLGSQFVVESVLLSVISLGVALVLVSLALPYIDKLSGRDLSPLLFAHPGLSAAFFIGTIGVGVLSGLYPAIYLSAFRPVKVLKGGGETGKQKGYFRNILVVGQFSSAIFLVIATVLIFRQLNFMEKQDPGFDRDQVVTIRLHGVTGAKYELLKQELSGSLLVTGVTGAQDHLGGPLNTMGFGFWPGDKPMQVLFTSGIFVDPDYLRVLKIPLLAGRDFLAEKSAFNKEFIINELLARQLLKDRPGAPLTWLIGKHLGDDTLCSIVGITGNFNFNSLHYKVEPLFLLNQGAKSFNTVSIKINGRQAHEALAVIESTWRKILPEYPFSYEFLDDHFRELYRTDTQLSQMVAIVAGLTILISCLGLFGLASFSAERRTKEIGIRKVLGASVQDVVMLLSKQFIGLVLIANLIAWPLAWLALHRWIQDYAYRVAISWWVFLLAGVAAVGIALLTVSFRAVKAAVANPVETLRTE